MNISLKTHKPKDDITLINTYLNKGYDDEGRYKETLTLIYKDNKTGMKYKEEIENPAYEYYVLKPEYRVPYPQLYVPVDHCEVHRCRRARLERDIATSIGKKEWYEDKVRSNDRKAIRNIHRDPTVFLSDNNVEDHYRFWFSKTYKNDICSVTKSFFDIEVDGIEIVGQFPEPGECPVNAITVIFQDRMETYTFLLRNPANPLIEEFEKELSITGTKELKEFVLKHVSEHNTVDGVPFYFGLENMSFNISFYDDEIMLIRDFFRAMNTFKPDFALAWNQAFDIPYLIARCERLGYAPEDIICHPDFVDKKCKYFIDERNKDVFEERCDYFDCSSYTVYLDQLIQYASRRKGQTKTISYALDAIGDLVANVKKLDYKDITQQIEVLPYKNYKVFVFYNVCDTISQYCIEYRTQDVEYVFGKTTMNNTRYSKIHRQTVYLTNRGQSILWDHGFVRGNNNNLDNPREDYPGAFVADPLLVSDKSRISINGTPSNIFANLFDSDFKSLYPSIMRQCNMFPHTQIGFIIIAAKIIHAKQNRTHYQYYTPSGQFCEDLQTHQWLEFAERWFGLLGFKDLCDYIIKTYTNDIKPAYEMHTPYSIYPTESNGRYYFPFYTRINPRTGYYHPFEVCTEMNDDLKFRMKEWSDRVAVTPNQSF